MGAKGCGDDNAFAGSAFASLKSERLAAGRPFDSKRIASRALCDCLACFYHRKRLPGSLGALSQLKTSSTFASNARKPT